MTLHNRLEGLVPAAVSGRVARVTGAELELRGLRLGIGDTVSVHGRHGPQPAQVVGLDGAGATALLLAEAGGLARGDQVTPCPDPGAAIFSEGLLGRTVDALGRPLDGRELPPGRPLDVHATPPPPLQRRRIVAPLPTGVRAVDGLCTLARGQRIGIFAGSGVGKSTLLGMMARGTAADVNVVALVGERGREVREFLEDDLGADGLARSVIVVATSDQPPLLRLRAGALATAIAEGFADAGADVLLLLDSLTRLAMAQREVGLAAGEPPTARGYTPSVFALLPRLLERAGPRAEGAGTITGLYTVLVDGDDLNDPVADAARSILDGHLVLDRRLADAGRYPPVDPLASVSRLAAKVLTGEQVAAATAVRAALAAAAEVRDLVEVGAYAAGSNPAADRGLALLPDAVAFLRQAPDEVTGFEDTWTHLASLAERAAG